MKIYECITYYHNHDGGLADGGWLWARSLSSNLSPPI